MVRIEQLHQRFRECTGPCTDTRAVAAGCMFFALKGPRFNANAFAPEALEKGALYAVVDEAESVISDRCLLVPDVLSALQELALQHRREFSIPLLAITGSNGKTTTKELAYAVMASDRSSLATTGNLNNHIGVPLTLLRINTSHRFAIIEMGASKPGDIAELMALAEPTHGLITNIGRAHLEGFGGYEGVLRTKTELYRHLAASVGVVFVNADDAVLMGESKHLMRRTYGASGMASTVGADASDGAFLNFRFRGKDGRDREVSTRLIGAYNLPNALAAVAVGQEFGVADDLIARALNEYVPSNNRSQFLDTGRNHVVADAYNANPSSMAAALRHFAAIPTDRKRLAILGDMLELGADAMHEHLSVVALAKELGLQTWLVGAEFSATNHEGRTFRDVEEAIEDARSEPLTGKLVLLKGSRGVRLEALIPFL